MNTGSDSPYIDVINSLLTSDKGFHSVNNVSIYNGSANIHHSQITGNTSISYISEGTIKTATTQNNDFYIGNNGQLVFNDLNIPIAINIASGWNYDIAKTNSYSLLPAGPNFNTTGSVTVDPIRYARGMGATLTPITIWGQGGVRVSYNGITKDYILNSDYPVLSRELVSELDKYFGWKYSWIPDGMTESVYLGAHGITGYGNFVENNINHTSLIVFASPDSKYYADEYAKVFDNVFEGGHIKYATLGAGPSDLNTLASLLSRPNDRNLGIKSEMTNLGIYDEVVIDNLFANRQYFEDNNNYSVPYNMYSGYNGKEGYNSNSFTSALLRSVGVDATPSVFAPGWSLNPLPETYFTER